MDGGRDRIRQSRQCSSGREIGCRSGSGSDQRKSGLASFFLLSQLLGLVLFVADSLGHHIGQEFEVVYAGNGTS